MIVSFKLLDFSSRPHTDLCLLERLICLLYTDLSEYYSSVCRPRQFHIIMCQLKSRRRCARQTRASQAPRMDRVDHVGRSRQLVATCTTSLHMPTEEPGGAYLTRGAEVRLVLANRAAELVRDIDEQTRLPNGTTCGVGRRVCL